MRVALVEIFIVDDHPLIRHALRSLLELEPEFRICGEAATAAEAMERIPAAKPDLILIDISLPDMDGIELVRQLRQADPDLISGMLTGDNHDGKVQKALNAGAKGYILKDDSKFLPEAIRRMMAGEEYLSPALDGSRRPSPT